MSTEIQHSLRQEARGCLSRAKELLAKGDAASVRYACLELRLAIEYVTYSWLLSYLDEVPNDTVKKWTPREVIASMLEVDPRADQSSSISMGVKDDPEIDAESMRLVGNDQRFSKKWVHTNHNAVSNFLHAPTVHQIEHRQVPSLSNIIRKAAQIAQTLESILSSRVFGINFGNFYTFRCECCSTQIKRRSGTFTDTVVCPKSECRASYEVLSEQEGVASFRLRRIPYQCLQCKANNAVPVHNVRDGMVLVCDCGSEALIRQEFQLVPVHRQAGST